MTLRRWTRHSLLLYFLFCLIHGLDTKKKYTPGCVCLSDGQERPEADWDYLGRSGWAGRQPGVIQTAWVIFFFYQIGSHIHDRLWNMTIYSHSGLLLICKALCSRRMPRRICSFPNTTQAYPIQPEVPFANSPDPRASSAELRRGCEGTLSSMRCLTVRCSIQRPDELNSYYYFATGQRDWPQTGDVVT